MKICLIHNLYGDYSKGGAEKIVELSARNFQNAGHEIFIITSRPYFSKTKNDDIYYLPSLYYNLKSIPFFLRFFWHIWDSLDFLTANRIKTILKQEKPDLVITHNLKGLSFLIPNIIKKLNIRHNHTLHDIQLIHPSGLLIFGKENNLKSAFTKFYIDINKKIFNSPNKIISPSKWLLELHLEFGFFSKSRHEVIQNINKNSALSLPAKAKNFLYLGQIEKHKGIIDLILAFLEINDQEIKLIIAGDGNLLSKAKNLSKKSSNIIFLGKINKEKINQVMKDADCLVVPSICYENSPTVIYEAIENNLPVIASNLGGIKELLPGKHLFAPTKEGIKKKLLQLIQ